MRFVRSYTGKGFQWPLLRLERPVTSQQSLHTQLLTGSVRRGTFLEEGRVGIAGSIPGLFWRTGVPFLRLYSAKINPAQKEL